MQACIYAMYRNYLPKTSSCLLNPYIHLVTKEPSYMPTLAVYRITNTLTYHTTAPASSSAPPRSSPPHQSRAPHTPSATPSPRASDSRHRDAMLRCKVWRSSGQPPEHNQFQSTQVPMRSTRTITASVIVAPKLSAFELAQVAAPAPAPAPV